MENYTNKITALAVLFSNQQFKYYIRAGVIMQENIILIGFMGTGKTAVGKRLASILNMDFMIQTKK